MQGRLPQTTVCSVSTVSHAAILLSTWPIPLPGSHTGVPLPATSSLTLVPHPSSSPRTFRHTKLMASVTACESPTVCPLSGSAPAWHTTPSPLFSSLVPFISAPWGLHFNFLKYTVLSLAFILFADYFDMHSSVFFSARWHVSTLQSSSQHHFFLEVFLAFDCLPLGYGALQILYEKIRHP